MLCTLPLGSRVNSSDNRDRSAGLLAKCFILTDTYCMEILLVGGDGGSVCPPGHAMANHCSLVCSILNDSFVFLEPINEGARAREAPHRQTGLTFHSFALRVWRRSRRLPLKRQAMMPSCSLHLHFCASPIAMALTVTLFGASKDFCIPAPPKKKIVLLFTYF